MTKEEFEEDIKIGQIWKFKTSDEEFVLKAGFVDLFGITFIT